MDPEELQYAQNGLTKQRDIITLYNGLPTMDTIQDCLLIEKITTKDTAQITAGG